MSILAWILFGLIVGAVAKLLMPGHDPGGIIVTIVLGVIGALVGGFIGRALGLNLVFGIWTFAPPDRNDSILPVSSEIASLSSVCISM